MQPACVVVRKGLTIAEPRCVKWRYLVRREGDWQGSGDRGTPTSSRSIHCTYSTSFLLTAQEKESTKPLSIIYPTCRCLLGIYASLSLLESRLSKTGSRKVFVNTKHNEALSSFCACPLCISSQIWYAQRARISLSGRRCPSHPRA